MPGNGGLCLHTIVLDPTDKQRMYVAISAGGVYRTDDGGRAWKAQNRGIRVMFMPGNTPSSGNVCTRSRCILIVLNVSSCKTIGASIAPTILPKTGRTLPTGCRRILVLP